MGAAIAMTNRLAEDPTDATVAGAGDRALATLADDDLGLLLLIRHFERKLLELFERGLLTGTTHTCLGQEHVPVALRPLFHPRDFVFSNHRGHGHYLARYRDPRGLLAEIMGRQGGVCGGVGGSQHLLRDRFVSTGVQGHGVPLATGAALRLKRSEPGLLACVYVGDGTWGEGVVYEALNMAQLWRVPLLMVVEHNGIAQTTPTALQMAGTIAGRAAALGMAHHRTGSTDVNAIRAELAPRLERVRDECLPLVVEFATHRLGPHSKGDDSRPPEVVEGLRRQDWYARCAAAFPSRFARCDREMRAEVDRVAREVADLPLAGGDDR
jgi:pyruvate dehydrogenase E1 component alpha subunit